MAKGITIFGIATITNVPVTVDGKIPSRHTANAIMQRAGIDYHF
jgi:hypothetical protein